MPVRFAFRRRKGEELKCASIPNFAGKTTESRDPAFIGARLVSRVSSSRVAHSVRSEYRVSSVWN